MCKIHGHYTDCCKLFHLLVYMLAPCHKHCSAMLVFYIISCNCYNNDTHYIPWYFTQWIYGVIRELIINKRSEIRGRRVTFEDLFGEEDIDNEYLRDKRIAENLHSISLKHMFRKTDGPSDILTVATQAITAFTPKIDLPVTPKPDINW